MAMLTLGVPCTQHTAQETAGKANRCHHCKRFVESGLKHGNIKFSLMATLLLGVPCTQHAATAQETAGEANRNFN
jgi:glutathione peroxidase-family protein